MDPFIILTWAAVALGVLACLVLAVLLIAIACAALIGISRGDRHRKTVIFSGKENTRD